MSLHQPPTPQAPSRLTRAPTEARLLKISLDVNRYAEGAVIIETGNTKVLCTASVDEDVPGWLKKQAQGWVTAEYAMLPRSTHTRSKRERDKVSGRTHEIQRLIARALRATVDLKKLGERQIIVDCDVLQADGGTRTAAITGASVALGLAIKKLESQGKIPPGVFLQTVQAVSVGLLQGQVVVDLDYELDSACDVDLNLVRLQDGTFVEVQGTGEKASFTLDQLQEMIRSATPSLDFLAAQQLQILA